MQVKTKVRTTRLAGSNDNETLVRVQKPTQGLKVKTGIKAGSVPQHSSEASGEGDSDGAD